MRVRHERTPTREVARGYPGGIGRVHLCKRLCCRARIEAIQGYALRSRLEVKSTANAGLPNDREWHDQPADRRTPEPKRQDR